MSKKRKRSKQQRQASKPKNYRAEKTIEYIFCAEVGIIQAATLLPELTDGDVLAALRELTDRIRSTGWPHFQEQPSDTDGLIAWLIVHGWEDLFRRRGQLSRRDLAPDTPLWYNNCTNRVENYRQWQNIYPRFL